MGGLGLVAAGAGVLRIGANSVEASVRVEGFRNSLTALYGSAQIANTVLADLQELSLLPGITFQSAVQGAVRLKTVGVEGDRALGVVREFGNAAALAGASTDAVGRSLVGFTQILSRGKISQEELNQILENVPLIGNSIREAFGSIDAEVIRDQLDAAGQSVQDFADILVNQLSKGARASADSTRNAFSNLENATFRLHAAIGDRLSPAVREATGFLTDLANTTADFVAGTNDATRSATSYADALMTASNAAAINTAIQGRIEFLRQEKAAIDEAAEGHANYLRLRGRDTAAGIEYREITEELGELTAALGNTATATEHFQGIQNQLLSEARRITQDITDLEVQRADETGRAYGKTTREIRDQREELAETQKEIGENAVVLRALASAQTVVTAETEKATTATEESTKAIKEATVEIITYAEAIRQVQANIEAYVEEQALLTDFGTFWEIAAGQAEGYSTAIDLTTASVVNLKNELDALTAAFDANLQVLDPESDVIDNLVTGVTDLSTPLTDASDEAQALAQELRDLIHQANIARGISEPFQVLREDINLVNPAVSEAVRSLQDYNDVLSETGVNFETVDSLSDRLTSSIRDQASAFDELARSAGLAATAQQGTPRHLQNQLPGQVIGSGVFDEFSAQTPSFTQGRGFNDPRIIGGDNTFENNLLALGRNLESFTEDFTVNVGDIVSAVEGGISPLDAFERSITQLDPALAVFTTTIRLLVEEIDEAERRREEFRRTRDLTETQRGTFGRGRNTGLGSDTVFPGSSGRFQTQIGSALSNVQGTGEEAIISGLLNQIAEAGADRPLSANLAALEKAYQPFIDGLQRGMESAGESLQHAIGQGFDESVISSRVDDLAEDTTRFYDTQIREVRAAAALTRNDPRNAVFALVRERDKIINDATNQLRNVAPAGPQNAVQFRAEHDFIGPTEGLTAPQDDQERGVVFDPAEAERVAAESLANVIERINEATGLINASILSVETQIGQSNDPAEIAELLLRVPALIAEKYAMLRQALDARLNAGEISVDVYNASLSELSSGESSELERHSDAMLANVVRMIDEDLQLIDASITDINTQIAGLSDPEAIAELLSQIPGLITEKYTRLREALDAKYAAGELSVDVYNASLSLLSSRESGEIEQQSDAMLAQTIGAIDDDVALIDANIGALQLAVENTDDPEQVAGLLDAIKLLVMDKYTRLRERLGELLANEEISQTAFDAASTALGTAESRELAGIDAQGLNAISEAAAKQVDFINGAIGNLRTSLELTDDPAEVEQILEAIRVLIGARFDILRAELEAIRANLSPEEYQQAFDGLNLAERLAFQNLDTEVFSAISAAAQEQVDFINGGINNLRLSLQLTEDPAELEQILNAIKVLVGARFDILIQELKDIEESLDPEVFAQALEGLGLGKLVAIQNIDQEITTATTPVARNVAPVGNVATEIRNIALETAERQTNFIDGTLDNLRTSLALTDDPAEIQQILDAIKTLTSSRFDSLRAELLAIRNTLSPEEYAQALKGLNLSETLSLNNIDTEKFAAISAEAQSQVDFVNGGIENLRLSIQLTDDPAERQAILDAIKILLMQRFTILRTELEKISESLSPEDYGQALKGLNLSETLSLNNIDTEKFGVISEAAQEQVDFINKDIENLRIAFELTDDPAERQAILDTIKILTQARFDLLREELLAIRESLSPEEYKQALTGLNLGETLALNNIDTEKFGVISAAAQKQVDFVNGAISNLELAFQLTDDPAEAQQILDAIKILVSARFGVLIQELKAIEDSFDDPALFTQALTGLELGSQVALRGIDNRSIGITLEGFTGRIRETDAGINALFDDLSEQTTASGITSAIDRLRTAITTKYDLIRERIEASAENEETQAAQIAAVNVQETGELQRLGEQGLGAFDSLINTAQFLLDNATEAEFATRRQALIDAINTFYDARIAFINGLDLSDTDRANMLAVVDIQQNIALGAIPQMHASVTERLEMEKNLQAEIADLRDDALDNEADRQQKLIDLEQDTQDRILDIQRKANRDREDLQTEFGRDIEDILLDAGIDESFFLSGDFQTVQRLAQIPGGDALRERLGSLGIDLSEDDFGQISDLARERLRDQQDIASREERRTLDVRATAVLTSEQITLQATTTATAIATQLAEVQAPATEAATKTADATTTTAENSTGIAESTQATADAQPAIMAELEPISEIRDIEQQILQTLGLSLAAHTRAGVNLEALVNATFGGTAARERLIEQIEGFGAVLPDAVEVALGASTTTTPAVESGSAELLELSEQQIGGVAAMEGNLSQPSRDIEMAIFSEVQTLSADIVNVTGGTVNVLGDIAGGASPQTQAAPPAAETTVSNNITIVVDLGDGVLTKVEGRLATRADQGLSVLKV